MTARALAIGFLLLTLTACGARSARLPLGPAPSPTPSADTPSVEAAADAPTVSVAAAVPAPPVAVGVPDASSSLGATALGIQVALGGTSLVRPSAVSTGSGGDLGDLPVSLGVAISVQAQGCWTATFVGLDVGRPDIDGCGTRRLSASPTNGFDAVSVRVTNDGAARLVLSVDCTTGTSQVAIADRDGIAAAGCRR
jgi:hypothetical protein